MKKMSALLLPLILLFPQAAFCADEPGKPASNLIVFGRFVLYFLAVMGVIFALLLLTKKIAAWIDKQRDKHKT